jgi:uncharacterized protein (TIGR02678 family)
VSIEKTAGALTQKMDQSDEEERQRALRALLCKPLLQPVGPDTETYALVRRHHKSLQKWLDYNTGWRLQVDSEFARLHKIAADHSDRTRFAVDSRTGEPLDRRRYMLVCLCLAALQEFERQTVLGKIAERVAELSASDPAIVAAGMALDLSDRVHRRDLVQAVRMLLEFGVLVCVDGDEERFVRQQGDVLYSIRRGVLTAMLSVRRGPSTIETHEMDGRVEQLLAESDPDTDEGRTRRLRWNLTRRLLDDPVLYYEDLSAAQLQYLNSQRPRLAREIEQATGLVTEVRAEGIAMADPSGTLTDFDMPEEGTDGHAALLTAQWLAERLRENRGQPREARISMAELVAHVASLIHIHQREKRHWRKEVATPGYDRFMAENIARRLEALRLICREGDILSPRPAIARYAVDEPLESKPDPKNAALAGSDAQ